MPADQPRNGAVSLGASRGSGQMAYLDFGDPARAPDVVFLHGNGFNARTHRAALAPLADEFRMLAIDLRGHGATTLETATEGRRDWRDLRDDVLAFLDVQQLERIVLAGHSMGGCTSLMAAGVAPGRVRALALFDPVIMPPEVLAARESADAPTSPLARSASLRRRVFASRDAAFDSYKGRGAFRTWPDEVLRDFVREGFRDLPDGAVTLACAPEWELSNYANLSLDGWNAFHTSRCPIHILRAERDSPCRIDGHLPELTASGRIRVETILDTTHFLPVERPDLVRAAIREAVAAP